MTTPTTPQTTAPEKQLITVDMVVTRYNAATSTSEVLLIRRGNEPFKGKYALPGGFVEPGETIEQAATRELLEETGIEVAPEHWKILGAYSEPGRDPRGRVISIVMQGHVASTQVPTGDDDGASAEFVLRTAIDRDLAFDHAQILRDANLLR